MQVYFAALLVVSIDDKSNLDKKG